MVSRAIPQRAVPPLARQRAATDKRARTRSLVLRHALECIQEEGIVAATAAKIAQRCGLTWGVIQYHFGDRNGLFLAVLEHGVDSLETVLSGLESSPSGFDERLRALVENTWNLLDRPAYRAVLEIQLQLGRDPECSALVRRRARRMRARLRDAWRKAMPECDPTRVDRAERLATTALRGLALERALEGRRVAHARDREALVSTLNALLRGEAP